MKIKTIAILSWTVFYVLQATAQVPVREEPRHHPVLQNDYFRLLDVWLSPGDTTLFHIHATPSLFVILSNTITGSQIKDADWSKGERSKAGTTWYRSFSPDTLVHRVCNTDTVVFHVNDIELLSPYNKTLPAKKHLPFAIAFENEKAIAYHLKAADFNSLVIKDHGPMIAELITGTGIIFQNYTTRTTNKMVAGKYLYIAPHTAFRFSAKQTGDIEMILFEIK